MCSLGRKKYEREYWFSVPKEKAKNLYHFFAKWAPEVYGDVDDLREAEKRGLEPITTDDELECEESEEAEEDECGTKDGAAGAGDKSGENKENDGKLNAAAAGGNKTKFWRRRSPLNFLKLVEDHFSTDGMSTDWNVSNDSAAPDTVSSAHWPCVCVCFIARTLIELIPFGLPSRTHLSSSLVFI